MEDLLIKRKKIKWSNIVYSYKLYKGFIEYRNAHPKLFKKCNNDKVAYFYLLKIKGREFIRIHRRLYFTHPHLFDGSSKIVDVAHKGWAN